MSRIYNEKKRHESAFELAKFLIKRDLSWQFSSTKGGEDVKLTAAKGEKNRLHDTQKTGSDQGGRVGDAHTQSTHEIISIAEETGERGSGDLPPTPPKETATSFEPNMEKTVGASAVANEGTTSEEKTPQPSPPPPTSLLIATSKGIVEIVKEILRVYPQAVEHVSGKGQNILHVAIQHRQLEIFSSVKNKGVPLARLVRRIDNDGYTILHHAGVNHTGASKLAPALQLQEELRWFEVSSSLLNIILVSSISLFLIIEYSSTSNFVTPICQYPISWFKSFSILLLFFVKISKIRPFFCLKKN